jgi:hypothetical protein
MKVIVERSDSFPTYTQAASFVAQAGADLAQAAATIDCDTEHRGPFELSSWTATVRGVQTDRS